MGRRVLAAAIFILLLTSIATWGQCTATGGDPSVTICSPTNGSEVPGRLRIVAATNSSATVDLIQVYLNGHKRWEKAVSSVDINLVTWSGGPYHVTVKAHDASGRWFQSFVDVTSSGSSMFCAPDAAPRSVTFCVPVDGEVIWTPYFIRAWFEPSSSGEIAKIGQIYLNGVQIWEGGTKYIPNPTTAFAAQPLPLGVHRLTFQAIDSEGAFKSSIWVRVTRVERGCSLPAAQPAVEICELADGATVSSPVRIRAAGNAKKGVALMQIYVDRARVFEDGKAYIDRPVEMTPGTHRVTVQALSGDGQWFNQTVNITVAP